MNGNGPRSERRAHLQRKSSSKKGRRAKLQVMRERQLFNELLKRVDEVNDVLPEAFRNVRPKRKAKR